MPLLSNKDTNYRSKPEIVEEILQALPEKKTKIMYKAGLSYNELKEYLQEMQHLELMDYQEDTRTFILKERGYRYLDIFHRMKGLAEKVEEG